MLYESLKEYYENTPQEILDKEREELEPLNEIGPDVFEWLENIKLLGIRDKPEKLLKEKSHRD